MRRTSLFAVALATAATSLACASPASAATPSKQPGQHDSSPADRAAIEAVLARYTRAVSSGDEAAFHSLLLSDDIAFAATDYIVSTRPGQLANVRHYADFRKAIFESGAHYAQTFDHVHIEQDAELASVTLDFVTRSLDGDGGGFGWKVLHLIKVGGEWKIASEYFTAYPLPTTKS